MGKVNKVDTAFIDAVKAQTSCLVSFENTNGGLKIRPVYKSDHHSIMRFPKESGVEFYTSNLNPEQQVRYVLQGFPPTTDCNEAMTELKENSKMVSNVRQIKRNAIIDVLHIVTLLHLWVITISKTEEKITSLKQITVFWTL